LVARNDYQLRPNLTVTAIFIQFLFSFFVADFFEV
jgi:hypothetical protein